MSDVVILQAARLHLGEREVLRDVDVRIEPGGFHCIIGPNGGGKTTLLRAMSGDDIDGVDLLQIDGQDARGMDAGHLAKLRAVLPQTMAPLFPYLVRDVVAWGGYVWGDVAPSDVDAALDRFDLTALADRAVTRLSGGEWARVRIAQAFLQRPAVLFADEPDAALDRAVSRALFQELAASRQTVVMVTHDLEFARTYATHLIGISGGRVALQRMSANVSAEDCEALWQ